MEPSKHYAWEMQLMDGTVRKQYEGGAEQTWKTLPLDQVVRVSFVPQVPLLPLHHIMIDITAAEQFVKRFGRGFMKQGKDGFKLWEYVNCCVTNHHRTWVFSGGGVIVTRSDYELYL